MGYLPVALLSLVTLPRACMSKVCKGFAYFPKLPGPPTSIFDWRVNLCAIISHFPIHECVCFCKKFRSFLFVQLITNKTELSCCLSHELRPKGLSEKLIYETDWNIDLLKLMRNTKRDSNFCTCTLEGAQMCGTKPWEMLEMNDWCNDARSRIMPQLQ